MITTCAVFLNISRLNSFEFPSTDYRQLIETRRARWISSKFSNTSFSPISSTERNTVYRNSSNSLDFMTVSSPSLPEFRCKFTEFYRFLGIPRHCRSSYLRPCSPRVAFHTRFQPRIFPPESGSRSSPRKEGGGKLMDLVGSPPWNLFTFGN